MLGVDCGDFGITVWKDKGTASEFMYADAATEKAW